MMVKANKNKQINTLNPSGDDDEAEKVDDVMWLRTDLRFDVCSLPALCNARVNRCIRVSRFLGNTYDQQKGGGRGGNNPNPNVDCL